MPQSIDRNEVQHLLAEGAQLVEVLKREEYEKEHLPGAISLPLRGMDASSVAALDRSTPVIVYCWDEAWDISPRAAWRLESLGFEKVYDYGGGKLDWMAAGLPIEGTDAKLARAGDVARKDVLTARVDEKLSAVRERAGRLGRDAVVVVNEQSVVMGLLRAKELEQDGDLTIENAMRPGPSTFRPYVSAREMAEYMVEHRLECSPITTSDGKLVGLLYQADAVSAAGKEPA